MEIKKVKKIKLNNINKRKRWFERKKLNHFNSLKLKDFYVQYLVNIEYSEKLLEIRFKSSFAFYLYLYLKSKAAPYEIDDYKTFCVSQPVEVNFGKLAEISKMTRNTVKKAFWSLVRVGLVIYNEDAKSPYHNSTKMVMLLNDKHLIGFDYDAERIIYSLNSKNYNEG